MTTTPADASAHATPYRIAALLRDGDVDAAIEAGLMDLAAERLAAVGDPDRQLLLDARQRLDAAWQTRERFRARQARLARIAREREANRSRPVPAASTKPALPAAAASALARALAKASGKDTT